MKEKSLMKKMQTLVKEMKKSLHPSPTQDCLILIMEWILSKEEVRTLSRMTGGKKTHTAKHLYPSIEDYADAVGKKAKWPEGEIVKDGYKVENGVISTEKAGKHVAKNTNKR